MNKNEPPKTNNGQTIDAIIYLASVGIVLNQNIENVTAGNYADTPLD